MESTMMEYPLTINHIVERAGRYYSDIEIVSRMPDKSLYRGSYGEVVRHAKKLASALQKIGIKQGDRVATLMWNHQAHLEAYFAVPIMGGVLHTLNLRLCPDDIAYIANHADDQVLIVDDVLLPLYEKFKDKVAFKKIIVVALTGEPVPEVYQSYESFLELGDDDFIPVEIDENAAAGMCFTSGTTGRPKGVVYSHRSTVLHSLVSLSGCVFGIDQQDVVTPVVPMFHVNAWGVVHTAALTGAKIVFPGPFLDAENLLDLYESEQVSFTAGVPTIWITIKQALLAEPNRWTLKKGMRMGVGGAAVPEELIRTFDQFGLRIIQAWGMTETSPLATVSLPKGNQQDLTNEEMYTLRAKVGVPLPFVDLRIVDDDTGEEQPWDGEVVGEIQVRGPWITASYFGGEGSGSFTPDNWLKTGDVATVDTEGFVKITDRTKDLIKSGGEWISSVELENAIMGHPDVIEAAVIAIPHPKWDERPLAAVVVREGAEVNTQIIREFLAPKFAKYWLPDAVEILTEIPKTSTGKFMKLTLRHMYKDWSWD